MGLRTLNVLSCELDESVEVPGFRHTGASIGAQIGANRISAGLYVAVADHAIWPYHYHYSTEEWMYVISGAPVLRDPGGRRTLSSGDLLCFPANHLGAHTVYGPGRFIIFATNESPGPWVSVYPDSDKLSVSPGTRESMSLNDLRLPRAGAVDYWHGESSGVQAAPAQVEREPTNTPSRPLVNALTLPLSSSAEGAPAGFRFRAASIGPALGGAGLGATVVELDPDEGSAPYHYEYGREQWLLILAGAPTLRHHDGETVLQSGDVVCFPEGPAGAHRLINRSDHVARVMFLFTEGLPANVCYPDSGTWTLRNGPDCPSVTAHETEAIGYWDW